MLPACLDRASDPSAERRLRRKAWLAMACVLLVGGALVGGYYVGVKGASRSAINRWVPVPAAFLAGADIYVEHQFPTPPIMALLLTPFTALPGAGPMIAWFGLKLVLTTLALGWLSELFLTECQRRTGREPPTWLVWGLPLAAFPLVADDLLHGNVNLWVLFLVVAGVFAYRRGSDAGCGLLLSLAAACKLTPALLVVFFAWKRAWRATAWSGVGLLLWLVLVPGTLVGFDQNTTLLRHWYGSMVQPYLVEGRVDTEQVNQSLPALITRLTTASVAIQPDDGRGPIRVGLLDLSPGVARGLVRLTSLGIILFLAWRTRHRWTSRQGPRIWLEVGLVLVATLLLSERSWKHHYVVALPGLLLAVALSWEAWTLRGTAREPRALLGPILLGVVFVAMATGGKDLVAPFAGPLGAKFAQAYGNYVLAALTLGGLLALLHPGAKLQSVCRSRTSGTTVAATRAIEGRQWHHVPAKRTAA